MTRPEDGRLLRGQGRYIDNLRPPGLLHMALVRSPHASADIRGVDLDGARRLDGVAAALSGADLAGELPAMPAFLFPGSTVPEHRPLAVDHVLAVGEPVAVVVADSPARAADAADLVEVDYAVRPAVVDPESALEPGSPSVHPGTASNLAYGFGLGEPPGLAGCEVVIEERLVNQRLAPSPMETRGVVADYRVADGSLTLHVTTQGPHLVRAEVARLLGIPEALVRVVAGDVGGAFGSKYALYPEDLVAAVLSRRLGRPVKWIERRSESMTATTHGRAVLARARLGASADGRIRALHVRWVADAGAHLTAMPSSALLASSMLSGAYRIPEIAFDLSVAYTNKTGVDPYRGFYRAEATYVVERMIDRLAREVGLDPVEVRRRNLIDPGELPYTTATGEVYDSGDYPAALDRALRLVDYEQFRHDQADARARARYLGIGVSTYVWRAGFPSPPDAAPDSFLPAGWEAASVRVERSGAVTVRTGASPHGQGLANGLAIVVSEALGVAPADVNVLTGDTAISPFGMGSAGSRAMAVAGSAVRLAADRVRVQATGLAAHLLEAAVDDIVWEGSDLLVRGVPARRISLAELASRALLANRPAGMAPGLEASEVFEPPNFNYPYGAHACVVEVDPSTGAVTIRRYVAVDDCGRAIDRVIVEGQIHGSVTQGLGQALFEEVAYDRDGQVLSSSLLSYAVPSAAELPSYEVALMETPTDRNPLGARGIGEAGTIGAPPAVVNAVLDALAPFGVSHLDMPLTPERVWRAAQRGRVL